MKLEKGYFINKDAIKPPELLALKSSNIKQKTIHHRLCICQEDKFSSSIFKEQLIHIILVTF